MTRYAKLVNAPRIYSGSQRSRLFRPDMIEVTYELRGGVWQPLRFQPVRVTYRFGDPFHRHDARSLRAPSETDWYRPVVDALTPEPGLPEFDIDKES